MSESNSSILFPYYHFPDGLLFEEAHTHSQFRLVAVLVQSPKVLLIENTCTTGAELWRYAHKWRNIIVANTGVGRSKKFCILPNCTILKDIFVEQSSRLLFYVFCCWLCAFVWTLLVVWRCFWYCRCDKTIKKLIDKSCRQWTVKTHYY